MQTKRMTITEGLVELKLYDSKIQKAINDAKFIAVKKKRDNRVGRISVEEFEKRAVESYQSIMQMIANRDAIKRAIVLSNATTTVEVAGVQMTVAEAIEKRHLNQHMYELGLNMTMQLTRAETELIENNKKVEQQADDLLVKYYGKDAAKKVSKEDYDSIVNPYKEANEYVMVDPINLDKVNQEVGSQYHEFMASVDTVLSVSNATTFIEVPV